MKILFLDQSGKMGGAEMSLMDVVKPYQSQCLVGLFADGPFRQILEQNHVPVEVLTRQALQVRKDSGFWQSFSSLGQTLPLICRVARLSRNYDVIYANTQKAFVIGAIASCLSRRPLVYHLRDILSEAHFSATNIRLAITLANRFASLVISNSKATQAAFIAAGGRTDIAKVVYNGFEPERYQYPNDTIQKLRQELDWHGKFIVGHFSRLSPWKGQHVLIDALVHCPEDIVAVLVGNALFGEDDYVQELHQQIERLGLQKRVQFLGFRSDVSELMAACNLVAHTSTAPEPFGRVIIEAMLAGCPVVAAADGGAIELVEQGQTGWLTSPGDSAELAEVISWCRTHREQTAAIAQQARIVASQQFNLANTHQQIARLLHSCGELHLPAQTEFDVA